MTTFIEALIFQSISKFTLIIKNTKIHDTVVSILWLMLMLMLSDSSYATDMFFLLNENSPPENGSLFTSIKEKKTNQSNIYKVQTK
jgi:hypothetical protein